MKRGYKMEEVIILDEKEFLIVDKITLNDKKYLYVIATDGSNAFTILNEYEEDGKIKVKSVLDENIVNQVMQSICKRSE